LPTSGLPAAPAAPICAFVLLATARFSENAIVASV